MELPSQNIRRMWTTVLVFHIACILLGVVLYFRPGLEESPPLQTAIGELPIQWYLQSLHLDTAYDFSLIDDAPGDYKHSIVIASPQNQTESKNNQQPILQQFPPEDIWPRLRARRYEQLALAVGQGAAGDPTDAAFLPAAIANGWLAQQKAPQERYEFSCQYQQVLPPEEVLRRAQETHGSIEANRIAQGDIVPVYESDLIYFDGRYLSNIVLPEAERATLSHPEKPHAPSTR